MLQRGTPLSLTSETNIFFGKTGARQIAFPTRDFFRILAVAEAVALSQNFCRVLILFCCLHYSIFILIYGVAAHSMALVTRVT